MQDSSDHDAAPRRELTLFDAICIIIGIVIGAGIFRSAPLIASSAGGAGWLIAGWVLGGLIALVGGLVFAELAVAYPRDGGEYVYLTRAYGSRLGLLYGWAQLWIVRPGNIGAVAFIFATYAQKLVHWGPEKYALLLYAVAAITLTTLVNALGVREGKWTQNALTAAKVLGLAGVCLTVFFVSPAAATPIAPDDSAATSGGGFTLAMILIMFTYGGWNDMPLVAAEVRDPRRNLVRALVLGAATITAIYLLVNMAFLYVLGYEGLARSEAVAADVLGRWLGEWGERAVSLLICVSCLGAINGMVLTGSRIYYAMGRDHRVFAPLGVWNARLGSPIRALLLQAAITLAVVIAFGRDAAGFERMVIFTNPAFWFFFTLTGVSIFILRRSDAQTPRPFRVPLYPLTPIVFCLSCLGMLIASVKYCVENQSIEAYWSIGVFAVGVVVCLLVKSGPAPAG
jgi:amino acid transporter